MLKVEHLYKTFSKRGFQLKDISFYIPKGYICGLIGENGVGKTTLIQMLIGLYRPDRGAESNITINGYDMKEHETEAKESIGFVLGANHNFYNKNMTLEQIGIFYGSLYENFHMHQYLDDLKKFQLEPNQKLKNLSTGMQVKVELAFALSHDAKLLIFDEPTAGMDKKFRNEFLQICTELVSDGEHSILISSHITEDLDRIADYIAYMANGEVLFCKAKDELLERFYIATGEEYQCKRIAKEFVVYMEQGEYSTSAMVVQTSGLQLDSSLNVKTPNVREFMFYFVKGGQEHAKDLAEKYL